MSEVLLGKEVATLAGGCFWCLEAVYDQLRGVDDVVSGYAGGRVPESKLSSCLRRNDRPC